MPRLSPLNMSNMAVNTKNIGTAFVIFVLKFWPIKFPSKEMDSMAGIVPKPKTAMKRLPFKLLPVAIAPAIAI